MRLGSDASPASPQQIVEQPDKLSAPTQMGAEASTCEPERPKDSPDVAGAIAPLACRVLQRRIVCWLTCRDDPDQGRSRGARAR